MVGRLRWTIRGLLFLAATINYIDRQVRFRAAVRVGTPVACGPERAMHSARACIAATEAAKTQTRIVI